MTVRKAKSENSIACPSEHAEQCALVSWWSYVCRNAGVPERLLFAIPNGGARSAVTGATLKAEGVRPGIPDLFLAVPSKGYNGLFVEMKKKRCGRISPCQMQAKSELERFGYCVKVCRGFEEAKKEISRYLCFSVAFS